MLNEKKKDYRLNRKKKYYKICAKLYFSFYRSLFLRMFFLLDSKTKAKQADKSASVQTFIILALAGAKDISACANVPSELGFYTSVLVG